MKTIRFVRMKSPGRPPQLSHSSRALKLPAFNFICSPYVYIYIYVPWWPCLELLAVCAQGQLYFPYGNESMRFCRWWAGTLPSLLSCSVTYITKAPIRGVCLYLSLAVSLCGKCRTPVPSMAHCFVWALCSRYLKYGSLLCVSTAADI